MHDILLAIINVSSSCTPQISFPKNLFQYHQGLMLPYADWLRS